MSMEIKTLVSIAPITGFSLSYLRYLRTTNSTFPNPQGKELNSNKLSLLYSVSEVLAWVEAYKAAPRGKKETVSIHSVGAFGIDNKMAQAFIRKPKIQLWVNYETV